MQQLDTQVTFFTTQLDKAEMSERCARLGIPLSEALRNGVRTYLNALELAEWHQVKRGRPRRETTLAA